MTVPAAPPSMLSKKFMELQIPTIQITDKIIFIKWLLKGTPNVSVKTKPRAIRKADAVCIIKRGKTRRPLKSSTSPKIANRIAGAITEIASRKVPELDLVKIKEVKIVKVTVMAIETPPRYGTGVTCFFLGRFGLSSAFIRIASFLIGHVKKPEIIPDTKNK